MNIQDEEHEDIDVQPLFDISVSLCCSHQIFFQRYLLILRIRIIRLVGEFVPTFESGPERANVEAVTVPELCRPEGAV